MAKKRRTRKQKILRDTRQKQAVSVGQKSEDIPMKAHTQHASPNTQIIAKSQPKSSVITTAQYQYLPKDLIKTAMLTGAIVLAELILFFVSKR